MKIGFVSLGCSKNLVDSQKAMGFLTRMGHEFVSKPEKADCIVVNTCGFINDAKQESIDTILQMAEYKQDKCKYLVVMGCLAQRYYEDLVKEMPEVDRFIKIDEYRHLPQIFENLLGKGDLQEEKVLTSTEYSAYLKISDGCFNRCAFCAIPLIRGKYQSETMEDLLAEAKKLEELGIKELNLIAQDSTGYGLDLYHKYMLPDLLRELNKMNFKWIRILYMYPDKVTDDLLNAIKECDKVVPYFDIPVQYGNDRMLKLMNRIGDMALIRERIAKIRSMFPDATLRTTMIVGFPTETKEDFNDLLNFVKETKWDRLGAFTYSREEGTTSYDMQPQIEQSVMDQRLDQLMSLQQQIVIEKNNALIGTELEVLIEEKDAFGRHYIGRSRYMAPDDIDGHIRFEGNKELKVGDIVKIKITQANIYDLFGTIV